MSATTGPRRRGVTMVCAVAGAAVLALIAVRAVRVPLTFDEAVTYERMIAADALAMLDFRTATNHLLNTVLTRVSHAMFGASPWALRLPNVLAAVGYLLALGAIASRVRSAALAVAGFVILATNLYAIDFFGLSRGYGIGLAALTVALWCLVRWTEDARPPWLVRALSCSTLAVVANFALLPAALALTAVAIVRQLMIEPRPKLAAPASRAGWGVPIALLAILGGYSLLVFSRDRTLSTAEFAPLTVRIVGLLDDELAETFVFREEVTGRFRELQREPGGRWRTTDVPDTWGLKIDLPFSHDRNLAVIEVSMDGAVFRRTRLDPGPWDGYEWNGRRVLRSTEALALPRSHLPGHEAAINWRGDALHWRTALAHTGVALAALAVLWLTLEALGRFLTRRGRLGEDERRAMTWSLLAAAGICAAPLYLLRRNGELYYGGDTSLVTDTLGSLAYATSYTRWFPAGVVTALAVLLLAAAAVTAGMWWAAPARRARLVAPLLMLCVLGLVALLAQVQHDLLSAPFPLGRTALFLWPIAGIWLWLLADALADAPVLRHALGGAGLLAAGLAAWHAAADSNVVRTFDDYIDASTPAMIAAIVDDVGTRPGAPAFVHLGVEWNLLPVARYYAERAVLPRTKILVHVVPDDEVHADYVGVMNRALASGTPLVDFPQSRSTLYRAPAP